MEFLNFIRREHDDFNYYSLAMVVISGALNGMIAVIVIHAAQNAAPHELNLRYLLMFIVALAAYWLSKKYTLNYNTTQVEHALENIRKRIADKIRKTDLQAFESVGRGHMFSVLNTDTLTLSQYTPFIINATGSLIMVLFALLFIAFVSKIAFLLTLTTTGACLVYFFAKQKTLNRKLQLASDKQNQYFESVEELLDGFKELKINAHKSNSYYQERLIPLSKEMETLKIETGLTFNHLNVFTQSFTFILMASIIFLIPTVNPSSTGDIPQIAAIMLFVIGPLAEIVGVAPLVAKSNISIINIRELEDRLDAFKQEAAGDIDRFEPERAKSSFSTISCEQLTFRYQNSESNGHGFQVGPINLEIHQGEIIFMIGGNGSGKSTFLKLFMGLYRPVSGEIKLDGVSLHQNNILEYRNLFSVIFSDFHMFKHLYGITTDDPDKIDELMNKMEIAHRCKIIDNEISDLNLSTGQKKRMALVTSLLEDKQVYIFDEWAADQDPDFRRYFYETILPEMKLKGKTVIAATHDDHYFDIADRIIKLDSGQVIQNPKPHL
ncbi:MAG: cyclic peptide export ABC transporter [Pseudomonadales bacterium]|uniref:Siderophore ABC transporter ATPase/permease n=1 Tax=Oleiphilus messinensis TaxID=141451 RepID=A0A1Y0I9P5_9GAMM|nr:cyclic peptide export ABC transporter [Oleiphilus messinensis]ARU56960.1 siderophore ABC transporter ATPase/permease [Oleiphilus messinensis]MCG8611959.1 cyclic peptide export ABC transporter [Pseudomonadales bacterium]